MSIGTIAIVDLRMLGLAFKKQTSEQLLKMTSIWTMIGLVTVISTGLVIFSTDALRYYYNWSFRYKCIALTVAVIYNYTIHRRTALKPDPGTTGAVVAGFSLLLWISIVYSGIFYAFT